MLEANADLLAHNATLKTCQESLLREKLLAEMHVEQIAAEKAELASENARLHIYAK